jgi:serine/threonine protein kinase
MLHLRTYQTGQHGDLSQQLLNEVATARRMLLDPQKKSAYDQKLKTQLPPEPQQTDENWALDQPDGSVFDEYVLLDLLGKGGTGQVFKAEHGTLGRVVALKILSREATRLPEVVARFRRKVKLMARFDHPNLVPAYDAGCREGVYYLVMGYVDGEDLGVVSKRFHPLPVDYVVDYLLQAASGLAYAHQRGIYHRNVKPSNILVDQQGIVKVIGLGLARIDVAGDFNLEDELTQGGMTLGTLDYMAPEQLADASSVDARADVYSLGCTLYRVLCGRLPYPYKKARDKALAHRNKPIPRLTDIRPEVSDSLERVYERMMAKQPADRYATMEDLIAGLQAITDDLVRPTIPAPASQPAAPAAEPQELGAFLNWVAEKEERRTHP